MHIFVFIGNPLPETNGHSGTLDNPIYDIDAPRGQETERELDNPIYGKTIDSEDAYTAKPCGH